LALARVVALPKVSRMKKEAGIVVESFDPFFPGGGAAKSINAFKINLPVSVFPDPVSPL